MTAVEFWHRAATRSRLLSAEEARRGCPEMAAWWLLEEAHALAAADAVTADEERDARAAGRAADAAAQMIMEAT